MSKASRGKSQQTFSAILITALFSKIAEPPYVGSYRVGIAAACFWFIGQPATLVQHDALAKILLALGSRHFVGLVTSARGHAAAVGGWRIVLGRSRGFGGGPVHGTKTAT